MNELEQLASEYGLDYNPNKQEASKYTDTHQIVIKPNPPRGYYYSIKSGNFDPYIETGYGSKNSNSGNASDIKQIKTVLNKYMPIKESDAKKIEEAVTKYLKNNRIFRK